MNRWIVQIGIAMVLGVVTTVAIAWAFAWLNRIEHYSLTARGVFTNDEHRWLLSVYSESACRFVSGQYLDASDVVFTDPNAIGRMVNIDVPATFRHGPDHRGSRIYYRYHQARGWPFLALSCDGVMADFASSDGVASVYWGLSVPTLRTGDDLSFEPRDAPLIALPLRPVWPGFLADVVIFGTLWYVALLIRRRIRNATIRNRLKVGLVVVGTMTLTGTAMTIVVAWICALCVNERTKGLYAVDGHPDPRGSRWALFLQRSPGAMRLSSSVSVGGRMYSGRGPRADAFAVCPPWAWYARPPEEWLERNEDGWYTHRYYGPGTDKAAWNELVDASDRWGRRVVDARGWPMLAMWGGMTVLEITHHEEDRFEVQVEEVVFGLLSERHHDGVLRIDWSRLIPLMPIWPGFAVNTLFYAGVWSVFLFVFIGPRPLVRGRRLRKGRCPVSG